MQFGLKTETIEQIHRIFKKYPQISSAILYGSRAKGNYRPGSDIDLTLQGTNLGLQLLNQISDELDDLLTPYKFDISIKEHIKNSSLLEHIERVGVVFYRN